MEWHTETDSGCYHGGASAVNMFNGACLQRRSKYPVQTNKHLGAVSGLSENGHSILRQAFDPGRLLKLKDEMGPLLEDSTALKFNDRYMQMINEPLLACPSAFDIAFDDLLVEIASEYFQCTPAIGTVNLKRSLKTDGAPEAGTLLYHCDRNSVKFMKFFFYLNDVDINGGPFCYVEGSHKQKFIGWNDSYRQPINKIESIYGKDRVKLITANLGDIVMANTTGFHRGTTVKNKERYMYTVNYVLHPEEWKTPTFKMKKEDYELLPDSKKPVADFLVKV